MSKYPDWINQFREKGTSVKKCGNNYYLYRTTSHRVPGKKNPQPVSKYIGIITRDGVIKTGRFILDQNCDVQVWEYGFSRTLELIAPERWKKHFADSSVSADVIAALACSLSEYSYLASGTGRERKFNLAVHKASLEEALGFSLSELDILKGIFLVELDGRRLISKISDQQRELLERLGVTSWEMNSM